MTIVDKLRKLITTKGGDPTGVMTIAEGVDRLEKTEEGDSSYHGLSPWPSSPVQMARIDCEATGETSCTMYICRPSTLNIAVDNRMFTGIGYFDVSIETDFETGDSHLVISEITFTSSYTEMDEALANCARDYFYERQDDYHFADSCHFLIGEPDSPNISFYVML